MIVNMQTINEINIQSTRTEVVKLAREGDLLTSKHLKLRDRGQKNLEILVKTWRLIDWRTKETKTRF